MTKLSTEIISFDDAGAADDHSVKGITMGHIRGWFDHVEKYEAALQATGTYTDALFDAVTKALPGIGDCTDEMAHAMSRLDGYDHDRDMPTLQRWKDYWDAAVAAAPHISAPAQAVSESIPRASHTARQGGWRLDFDWLVGMQDGIEEATGYNITLECLEEAVVRTEAICTAAQPPADPVEKEVQDTWLVGGPPDFMAMSGSVESDRVIQLHMRRKATDEDRKWLLDAINAKLLADKAPPQCSAATDDLPWWKILADNWRGRNGNSTTGDSVRNSCADKLEKCARRHHSAVPQSPLPASMALAFASERERLVETLDLTPGALISYLAGYDEATELALALSRPHGGSEK